MTQGREDIWFARVGNGTKMVPINAKGMMVAAIFAGGMVASSAAALAISRAGPIWLWIAVLAVGCVASAAFFIITAYRHTDHAKTVADYKKDRSVG